MFNAGILHINDILDDDGGFLKLEDINNVYNIALNIMQYNSIKDAIPVSWRLSLKRSHTIQVGHEIKAKINNKVKDVEDITNKDVYWELVNRIALKGTAMSKWEELYATIEFNWNELFGIPYIVARETTLQSLQYQILHRFYPCNAVLGKWYKDHTNLCENCNQEDNIEHYFYKCLLVQVFWNSFNNWWLGITNVNLNIQMFDILFGIANPFKHDILDSLNYCILFAKLFISKQKKGKQDCIFYKYKLELKERLNIERVILIEAGKEELFEKKWKSIFEAM